MFLLLQDLRLCDHITHNLLLDFLSDLPDTLLVRADQGDVHTFLKDRIRPDTDALALETGLQCGEIWGDDGFRSAVSSRADGQHRLGFTLVKVKGTQRGKYLEAERT